jgi:hypothetical protein
MTKFLFVYHGGGPMPTDPAEIEAVMAKWTSWMGGLGDALTDPGNPVGKSTTVSADGVVHDGGPNPAAGYSIIEAEDLDAALAAAKTCPMVESGTVEVAPIIEM